MSDELALPSGCALCGEVRYTHGVIYDQDGSHPWLEPTREQRKARMRARRLARAITPTPEHDEQEDA